jgi:sugar fermentation stimulation protein A
LKNCHLRRSGSLAEFPDCVAARSLKHLRELTAMVEAGHRAVMLFVIQRTDCDAFEACHDLDPAYAKGLTQAAAAGVEVLAYACAITRRSVRLDYKVPWQDTRPWLQ